ncbi:hypothetical protein [Rufibacter latericius]|uniref:Uncharacterized protein n=1 Tax=Rufibacter latericius TaxID=2487040 RepID=A0A3M9MM53_9BACT|nr:hypothetical protein [Rufibacter latericius]RNI26620.1 hypothetical protein EFB08_11420 [Rufibacter latericius]
MKKLSQTLTVALYPVCPDKGVFLRWKNQLGGIDGWFFGGKKSTRMDTESIATVVSHDGRKERSTGKVAREFWTVRCGGLTVDQAEAKRQLYQSPQVQMWNPDGSFTDVEVVAGSFTIINESEKKRLVTLEILLPKPNALVR